MIIDKKETTVAYRCPACGAYVLSLVGIFALSGDMIRLKCSCGGSELTMTYTSDRKIRLSVPCIICPHDHSYVISSTAFFDGGVLAMSCAYTGLDICFIGHKDDVIAAAKASDEALSRLLADNGLDGFEKLRDADTPGHGVFGDAPTLHDLCRFALCELSAEGAIHCRCPDCGVPDENGECDVRYNFELVGDVDDSVLIHCSECGASGVYPASELFAADGTIKMNQIYLM